MAATQVTDWRWSHTEPCRGGDTGNSCLHTAEQTGDCVEQTGDYCEQTGDCIKETGVS